MVALTIVSPGSNSAGERVTATGELIHRCPFRNENDFGRVTITWAVDDKTLELHSLAAYLGTFADVVTSHEAITALIYDDIREAGVNVISVHTDWSTAGLDVGVTRDDAAVLRQSHELEEGA